MGLLDSNETLADSGSITAILRTLQDSKGEELSTIKDRLKISRPILPLLLWLNSMNFVEREEITMRHPVIQAKWRITQSGRAYLSFIDTSREPIPYLSSSMQVLLVAPRQVRNRIKGVAATDLHEALIDILVSAKTEVLISSPYIDATIVPLLRNVNELVEVKILTEDASSPVFRRIADTRPRTEIRYLRVMDKDVQLFQVHAKFLCVDKTSAVITSAT